MEKGNLVGSGGFEILLKATSELIQGMEMADEKEKVFTGRKLVAIARDGYLTPQHAFPDLRHLGNLALPRYGQDITTSVGRQPPVSMSVGKSAEELKPKMRKLLKSFAGGDRTGMAKRLFDKFLTDTCRDIAYFDDESLAMAAKVHPHINSFLKATIGYQDGIEQSGGKVRLHQALRGAAWDIEKISLPLELGVPAFNRGSPAFATKDYGNGLGLMVNGIQHVYVIASKYTYSPQQKRYSIDLKFVFYDVFGLDDGDLREYGAAADNIFSTSEAVGITAWWQLQHQHNYAPLVTRIVINKTYENPAI